MVEMSVYVSSLLVGTGHWVGRRCRWKFWAGAGWSGVGWSGSSSTREN